MRNISLTDMSEILVEAGELIARGGDYFEDMGGHIIHESSVPEYFDDFLRHMKQSDRAELLAQYVKSGE